MDCVMRKGLKGSRNNPHNFGFRFFFNSKILFGGRDLILGGKKKNH